MTAFGKFLNGVIDPNTNSSSKRFITLLMLLHFIITAFLVTFFVFYLIIFTPKGTVNETLVGLLKDIIDVDKYVILGGIGLITAEAMAKILVQKNTKINDRFIDYFPNNSSEE